MTDRLALYEVADKVGVITLNRPEKLNAISAELQQHLTEAFARADADPGTSVVLLRAEGRSFATLLNEVRRELARNHVPRRVRPRMTVQQHERRAFAAVPNTQRRFLNIDELDLEAVEEGHAEALP